LQGVWSSPPNAVAILAFTHCMWLKVHQNQNLGILNNLKTATHLIAAKYLNVAMKSCFEKLLILYRLKIPAYSMYKAVKVL